MNGGAGFISLQENKLQHHQPEGGGHPHRRANIDPEKKRDK